MFNNDIHDICNPRKIQVFNLKELQGTTLLGKNSIWNSRNREIKEGRNVRIKKKNKRR